jgi:hypothetical protein
MVTVGESIVSKIMAKCSYEKSHYINVFKLS